MNVLFRPLTICFAALYLWVSGTLLWHEHEHSHAIDTHEQACDQHTSHDSHTHDAETCSICFFIHTAKTTLSSSEQFHISEKDIVIQLNDRIPISYDRIFIKQKSNKGPPFLS
jgi:ABC-type nickel/cobalt efflux system permease component RcnA